MKIISSPFRYHHTLAALISCLAILSTAIKAQERNLGLNTKQLQIGGYYALVIGNNAYQYIQRLKTAEDDARGVEAVLRTQYGFQTKLMLNATREQIVTAFNSYRRELDPNANLLIYYAGHGVNDKDIDRTYWLPVDARLDNNSNWISADDITSNIRGIPAKHILIVSDSCYSGTLSRGLEANLPVSSERQRYLQKMLAGKSRTLMASGGNEPVADGGGGKHSIFASALLRGLSEMDKGQYTASELFRNFIQESVAGRANQTPEYNPLRNSGHESGDFVFVKITAVVKSTVSVAKDPIATPFDPAAIELSYWETIKNSTDPADYQAYLVKYPTGLFADIANRRALLTSSPASPLLPSVDDLLNRYFRAIGGKEALGQVSTIVNKGSYELIFGKKKFEGEVEMFQKRPGKSLLIMKIGKSISKEVYDGETGWLYGSDTGIKAATARQLEVQKRSVAWTDADLDKIKQLYQAIVVKNKEKVDGREVFIVEATLPNGKIETLYFDVRTSLIYRWDIALDSVSTQPGVVSSTQIYLEDYVEIGGIMMPMTIRQVTVGFSSTMKFGLLQVKFNVPLDDRMFSKPSK